MVSKSSCQPKGAHEEVIYAMVPLMASLFETIKCLLELPDLFSLSWYFKSPQLSHVDCFIENSIQEGASDIHVSCLEGKLGTEGKEYL